MIMAFWGAPVHDPQHHQHAVLGALAMLDKLVEMQPDLSARGWPKIEIGVGINSGMMNVGDMGSEYRRAYTVIGDAVNLGFPAGGSDQVLRRAPDYQRVDQRQGLMASCCAAWTVSG